MGEINKSVFIFFVGRGILDMLSCLQARMGRGSPLCEMHDCIKRILMHGLRNTFVKLLSVTTSMVKMSLANVHTFTEVG